MGLIDFAAQETFRRVMGNMEFFLAHGLLPLSNYMPDIDTLRKGKPRIVVAAGEMSAGQTTYNTRLALAKRLGQEPVLFPGDHVGFTFAAQAFARRLDQTLTSK